MERPAEIVDGRLTRAQDACGPGIVPGKHPHRFQNH
jgi:hypothetical protein